MKTSLPFRGDLGRLGLPEHQACPAPTCTRRNVLKYLVGTLALATVGPSAGCAVGRTSDGNQADSEFEISGRPKASLDPDSRLPIVWIEAGVCTGCAVTLLNSTEPTIETVLPLLRLEFQETLMDRSGAGEMDRLLASTSSELANKYLLIVDGTIPAGPFAHATTLGMASRDYELTAQDLVTQLAQHSAAIVALGTCACFGGITAAAPNPANHRPLADFVPQGKPLIRIPGCPPHPAWILETLTTILTTGLPGLSLDALGRPLSAFGGRIHDYCPRRSAYDAGDFAEAPGAPSGCFLAVGCKGPDTHADCPKRLWASRSSCIHAGHPCIGCAAPGFPDARGDADEEGRVAMSPIYS
jgi:hydrogenase small subunit